MILCLLVSIASRVGYWANTYNWTLKSIEIARDKAPVPQMNLISDLGVGILNVFPMFFLAMGSGFNLYLWTIFFFKIGKAAEIQDPTFSVKFSDKRVLKPLLILYETIMISLLLLMLILTQLENSEQ